MLLILTHYFILWKFYSTTPQPFIIYTFLSFCFLGFIIFFYNVQTSITRGQCSTLKYHSRSMFHFERGSSWCSSRFNFRTIIFSYDLLPQNVQSNIKIFVDGTSLFSIIHNSIARWYL